MTFWGRCPRSFGASIVQFAWGWIGTKGQGRAVSFACADEAAHFARRLLRRRASAPKRIGVLYREVALAP
ncbi:WGR domain-containing protein [Novosphingobium lubricantis]|uniref:WGR domain-containing protein n=1 Tax=Sphingobium sp. Ndbn-10 TaxID=1667223 RepID=UPI0011121F51|nr:WGR domain-containing protein [Sphingobium sp. Ndbn-10]